MTARHSMAQEILHKKLFIAGSNKGAAVGEIFLFGPVETVDPGMFEDLLIFYNGLF
jgi:hypothetical protein